MPRPPQILVRRNFPYAEGLEWQRETVRKMRADSATPEFLLFAEHPPTLTFGRAFHSANLKISPENLSALGVATYQVERGGDVTYHGPGQWTLYPLLRLGNFCRDLHRYLRLLEEVVIVYLRMHNVGGERRNINSGVWIGRDKIAAVGVACSGWISWHGIAINVQPDLTPFSTWITPCGISPEVGGVTSLARVLDKRLDFAAESVKIAKAFLQVFAPIAGYEFSDDEIFGEEF